MNINTTNENEYLYTEKYRPKSIEECILPKDLKKVFSDIVKDGNLPSMILSGTSGLGKTTVARALCAEMGLDCMMINGSKENGIDILRNQITQFASTVSMTGGVKVVIIDEADYLNATSTMPALRGFIEEFSNNCRFILTCNLKHRIISPIHSRCTVIDFNTDKKTMAPLAAEFMERLSNILQQENVKYEDQTLAELIIKHAPDWRRVISECQRFGASGEIPTTILLGMSDSNIEQLFAHLKTGDFKQMRQWVATNANLDSSAIFRKLYDGLSEIVQPESIPGTILVIADYLYKDAMIVDKEINLVACLTELMGSAKWKN